jgi:solute carrier family 35 protein F5
MGHGNVVSLQSMLGMTVQGTLTWVIFGYLVAKGMLDDVVSEYLWARAVVLMSATVATVGLGLTIQLAFVSDWVMGHGNVVSLQSVLGVLSVLVGFILVNIGNKQEEAHDDGQIDETATEVLE